MYHSSWSEEAISEFEKCITAHGGWSAWQKFDQFHFDFKKFSGVLLAVKGLNRSFVCPKRASVNPKTKSLIFDYDSHKDFYNDGALVYSKSNVIVKDGKELFSGTTFEQWSPAHSLYFFGYAVVNYTGYPFILPEHELLHFAKQNGHLLFDIKFPDNFRTHCRVQRFYFDRRNLLVRHDYRAPLAGPLVYGAHETWDYKEYKGLQIPQTRKVKPRFSRWGLRPYGIYAELTF